MHQELDVVIIGVSTADDPAKTALLKEALHKLMDSTWKIVEKIALDLHVSIECAIDICYLRTRPRWTPALEKELIRLHKAGTPPKIVNWPK